MFSYRSVSPPLLRMVDNYLTKPLTNYWCHYQGFIFFPKVGLHFAELSSAKKKDKLFFKLNVVLVEIPFKFILLTICVWLFLLHVYQSYFLTVASHEDMVSFLSLMFSQLSTLVIMRTAVKSSVILFGSTSATQKVHIHQLLGCIWENLPGEFSGLKSVYLRSAWNAKYILLMYLRNLTSEHSFIYFISIMRCIYIYFLLACIINKFLIERPQQWNIYYN